MPLVRAPGVYRRSHHRLPVSQPSRHLHLTMGVGFHAAADHRYSGNLMCGLLRWFGEDVKAMTIPEEWQQKSDQMRWPVLYLYAVVPNVVFFGLLRQGCIQNLSYYFWLNLDSRELSDLPFRGSISASLVN